MAEVQKDDLLADWGAAMEEQGAGNADDMADQWAAMIDEGEETNVLQSATDLIDKSVTVR